MLDKNYFLRLLQYHCIWMKYVKSQFDSDQFEGCSWLRCAATGTFITPHCNIYTRRIKAQGRFTAVCLRGRGWGPRWGSGGQSCRQLMLDGDVSVSQSVCGTIRDKVLDGSTAKTYETIFDYLIIPDLIDQLIVTIWLMVLRLYIFFKGRVKSRKKKVLKIKHPLQVLTMTTFFLGIWNNSEQLWKKKIPFVPFVC